ncbi:MAG: hypothetical protein JWN54_1837 [Mycobacterium sp.]|nr:hypothetical protein [Mycobacterium sp.]
MTAPRLLPVSRRAVVLLVTAVTGAIELLPVQQPVVLTIAGLWLVLAAPAVLWQNLVSRVLDSRDARWLLAAGLTVLTAIVTALVLNSVLPVLGYDAPLSRPGLALASMATIGILAAVDRRRSGPSGPASLRLPTLPHGLAPVAGLGVACLVAAVAGAFRLNNGLGSAVSVAALLLVATLLGYLLLRRRVLGDEVIEAGIFLAAAALLLLISLRGWYITGHDIQREFRVYELTASLSRWDISAYRDAYNSCLSITLLPTTLTRLTGIPGLYVFKVLLPLLFALTPVLVYRVSRDIASKLIALLAAIYVISFPTFVTDMTFLGRQEIAFLLLGCAALLVTGAGRRGIPRRVLFTVLLAGVVLSHYSTAYMIVAVLVLAKLAGHASRLIGPLRRRLDDRAPRPGSVAFVTWSTVFAVALVAFLWTGPATHTSDQLRRTLAATAQDILHPSQSGTGSSDVSYSLFSGPPVTAEARLKEYSAEATRLTAGSRAAGASVPLSVVEEHPAAVAPVHTLPLTALGRVLADRGVDVSSLNGLLRKACAGALQLLLLLGLLRTLVGRRTSLQPTGDLLMLAVASIGMIGIQTVLPALSVDYGLLRSFQQGLFFFAPFIAVGSVWAFSWAGRMRVPAASALALFFFLDLTGVLPKALGSYPAQLHLDNSGQYYDIYYVHPEERSAMSWVVGDAGQSAGGQVQSEVQTDRYTFSRLQTLIERPPTNDIYPTLVSKDSYVFLGYTTVRKNESTVFYRGDLVTYRYPLGFLESTKNKVYSSDGASVYR